MLSKSPASNGYLLGGYISGIDLNYSLTEIENDDWGNPSEEHSGVQIRCLTLRKKKLSRFDEEDLRVMIGQNKSLPILIPIALEKLAIDPLVEGWCYEGDFLCAVLRADKAFYKENPKYTQIVESLLTIVNARKELLSEESIDYIKQAVESGHWL